MGVRWGEEGASVLLWASLVNRVMYTGRESQRHWAGRREEVARVPDPSGHGREGGTSLLRWLG